MKKNIGKVLVMVMAVSMMGISVPRGVNASCNHSWYYVDGDSRSSSHYHYFSCSGNGHAAGQESCKIVTTDSFYVEKCRNCGDTRRNSSTHTQHLNSHCSKY